MPYIFGQAGGQQAPGAERTEQSIGRRAGDHGVWRDRMLRFLKGLIVLGVVAIAALAVYAYLGDMAPDRTNISQPVELNVGN